MDKKTNFLFLCLFLLLCTTFTEAHATKKHHRHRHGSMKLFVFGDSYVDTGNSEKFDMSSSWKEPYGITFPGKPAGRFSDGRVLTDYIASFLGIRSPEPYKWRKVVRKSKLLGGMNFAYGGTGVFNTYVKAPNMTTQINYFQQLLERKVYSKHDLDSSVALVSVAGNDYGAFLLKNGSMEDLPAFTTSINNQLAVNLKRIHGLGVRKIAVTAVEPMGCLPAITASSSHQNCSKILNSASNFHNKVLQETVLQLNNESESNKFVYILDLYSAFTSTIFQRQENTAGNLKFKDPLKPCCVGVSNEYSCGSLDESGAKKYTVCNNPELSFFWDTLHPSQHGWHAVYSVLQSSLHHLY